eukprot:3468733-Pyramimonas_sp.AAC.1
MVLRLEFLHVVQGGFKDRAILSDPPCIIILSDASGLCARGQASLPHNGMARWGYSDKVLTEKPSVSSRKRHAESWDISYYLAPVD